MPLAIIFHSRRFLPMHKNHQTSSDRKSYFGALQSTTSNFPEPNNKTNVSLYTNSHWIPKDFVS